MAGQTQDFFEQIFQNSVLAEDPNQLYSFIQGQDNYFMQKAIGLALSLVASEVSGLQDNIFPSSSNSTYLDKHLTQSNLPPRSGALPSVGVMQLVIPSQVAGTYTLVNSYKITTGTVLVNILTGANYTVQSDVIIPSGTIIYSSSSTVTPITFDFLSQQTGSLTYSNPQSLNTFSTPINLITSNGTSNVTITITQSIINSISSGIDSQTDYDVSYAINKNSRSPKGSGGIGDFSTWTLQSSNLITDSVVIPNGLISGATSSWIYIAIMTGSRDPNVNINIPYPLSRQVNQSLINTCQQYLETKRGILDDLNVINILTYTIARPNPLPNYIPANININLIATLSVGLTKDTVINGSNGVSQSIDAWIRQQFRYAILSAPYQGESIGDNTTNKYIKNDTIVTILKSRLGNDSSSVGSLAAILEYVSFTYSDVNNATAIPNIPVPNFNNIFVSGSNPGLLIVYDIDTSDPTIQGSTGVLTITYQYSS